MRTSELEVLEASRPKIRPSGKKKRRNLSGEVCGEFRRYGALVAVTPGPLSPNAPRRRYGPE